jgi:hypothetical protein
MRRSSGPVPTADPREAIQRSSPVSADAELLAELALQGRGWASAEAGGIVGMEQGHPGRARQLAVARRQPIEGTVLMVDGGGVGFRIDVPHADLGGLGGERQALLALAQRGFG